MLDVFLEFTRDCVLFLASVFFWIVVYSFVKEMIGNAVLEWRWKRNKKGKRPL